MLKARKKSGPYNQDRGLDHKTAGDALIHSYGVFTAVDFRRVRAKTVSLGAKGAVLS